MTDRGLIVAPGAPPKAQPSAAVRWPSDLRGKVVGFIDNSKNNFDVLVEELSAVLMQVHGVKRVVARRKPAASVPATFQILDEIGSQCDLVIAGSGD